MRKLFKKIHLWISIPFGLIMSITCFTGAMLVFEKEITQSINPQIYTVADVKEETLPIDSLVQLVAGKLPKGVTTTGITISSNPQETYLVNLSEPKHAAMSIDQYTGEIKGKKERSPFFTTIFKIHRWLLDSVKRDGSISVGKTLVGISTIMFAIALITGIIIWIPRSYKDIKKRFTISVHKGNFKFWHDLHIVGGIYVAIFLLIMAITGLTWSFDWYNKSLYKILGIEMQQKSSHQGKKAEKVDKERENSQAHNWEDVYIEVKNRNPNFKQITIEGKSASVTFDHYGNQRAADKYNFNPRSGKITELQPYSEQPESGKVRGWILSLHIGNWGGIFTRILYFIAALIGGTLPLTGYYIWIKKLLRNKS